MAQREHVEKMESGGMCCRHCGSSVDDDGYSVGGDAQDGDHDADSEVTAMQEGDTGEIPQQYEATKRMRSAAFADAISRRAR